MNYKIVPILFCCIFANFTNAEVKSSTTTFDFATIQLDAHQVALGGAASLSPAPGTAHWGNPALLSAYGKNCVSGAFSPLWADIDFGGITGAFTLKNEIMIAPSFRYMSVGTIVAIDKNADTLPSTISPFSFDGGVTVSYKWIPTVSSGLTVRHLYESLTPEKEGIVNETNASALLFDGGIYFLPTQNIALSAGFRNTGVVTKKYDNDDSELPSSVYSGIRYFTKGTTKSNMLIELEKVTNYPLNFKPALELQMLRDMLSIRFGTSVSTDDIQHFVKMIGGTAEKADSYTKTESQVASVGVGLLVPLHDKNINFDFATKFLGDGMGFNFAFSGGYSF